MPTKALSERPSKVALAVKFLYLVVGLGIIRAVMTIIRHADVRSPDFLIYTKIIIYAGSVYLIYQLNKGRNWARWFLGVIFIIAIPLVILPAFASYSHNPVAALITFIRTALYIIGMVFLFHRSSSNWFGAEKISKKSEG
jgi:hypothetical protein